MIPAIVLAVAYLLGAIPFGFLIVKWKTGRDVRSLGSGNIGATNVLRTTSRGLGILTLALDIFKAVLAVSIARRLSGGDPLWTSAAALAVMAGHAFPVFLKFRGGKAVASFVGAFLYLTPLALVLALLVFLLVFLKWRYVSLGSIAAAGSFPALVLILYLPPPLPLLGAAVIAAAFIVWRHSANIARLRAGTEHAISFGGKRA